MRGRVAVAVLVAGAVVFTGCSSGGQALVGPTSAVPTAGTSSGSLPTTSTSDAVTVDWRQIEVTVATGSVPPPYNHLWLVDIDPGTRAGTLTWRTNYAAEDQEWSTTFLAQESALPALYELAAEIDGSDYDNGDLVGGGQFGLTVTKVDGTEDITRMGSSQESADAGLRLKDAARSVIPDDAWTEVETQYQDWADSQD